MEPLSAPHAIALVAHLLLFAYWLGADVGVFYSSGFVVNPGLTREARLTAAKIMLNLDLIPRICMSLMLTVSGLLTEFYGIPHPGWQMAGIVALGPVWLGMVLFPHFREGTAAARQVQRLDFAFRCFMIAAVVASAVYLLASGRLHANPWIAAKLLVFACLIFCGLMVRVGMPPIVDGFRKLATTGASDADNLRMQAGLAKVRPWVLATWVGLLAEAVLGVMRPGAAG